MRLGKKEFFPGYETKYLSYIFRNETHIIFEYTNQEVFCRQQKHQPERYGVHQSPASALGRANRGDQ